jgi:xanthine dehydrogenase accessory factor
MHGELLKLAADLARREEPFVLATAVRRQPPSSVQVGDMAVVTADGAIHGRLSASCTRRAVIRESQRVLADGQPRLVSLTPQPEGETRFGVDALPMSCQSGGSVDIYLDPVLPAPRLVIFGSSPVARALAALGEPLGYRVSTFEAGEAPPPPAEGAPAPFALFAVVATLGEDDEAAIRAALALSPTYLGVVASARRFAQMRDTLLARGVAAAALDGVRCPAGLPIGARAPEEIALAILAEIVAGRSKDVNDDKEEAKEKPAGVGVDPVCGMSVEIATARYTAELGGRTWYFCCGGCRERFLAAPETFLSRGAA